MKRDAQYFLKDVLQELTRKERRNLLGVATIGLVVVWTGIRLTGVSALGITFEATQYERLLFVWGWIVLYFLVAFVLYASSDLVVWLLSESDESRKRKVALRQLEGQYNVSGPVGQELREKGVGRTRGF